MTTRKILLFEPMDTDFGGHYFEHSSTYIRFLIDNNYEPIFVLGGMKTGKLEALLKQLNVRYYKLGIPVYKARSRLPSVVKNSINIFLETLRHLKLIKIAEKEGVDLITLLTFGVYEPFQLYIAALYQDSKIPIKVIIHTITIDETFSFNPRKLAKYLLSFFSLIFLRKLAKKGIVNNIVVYSDMAEKFYKNHVTKNVIRVLHPINFDYDKFDFTKDYSKKIIGLDGNGPILLLLNPDTKGKIIDNLFEALPDVKGNFKIIAVGYMSHSFETKIKDMINNLGLKDKVIIINKFLSTEEKYHYINASDLVLLPYRTSYKRAMATSSILAEAIMMLKPVIITNGVIEGDELVRENSLGLVVNDDEKSWSEGLDYILQNLDKVTSSTKTNAVKIRYKFRYSDVLKKVYGLSKDGNSPETN